MNVFSKLAYEKLLSAIDKQILYSTSEKLMLNEPEIRTDVLHCVTDMLKDASIIM